MNNQQFKEKFEDVNQKIRQISLSEMNARYKFQELLEEIKEQDEIQKEIIEEIEEMKVYFQSIDSSIAVLFEISEKVKEMTGSKGV